VGDAAEDDRWITKAWTTESTARTMSSNVRSRVGDGWREDQGVPR